MPYIQQTKREVLLPLLASLEKEVHSVGDLNYVITMLCRSFFPSRYEEFNALVGVLESAKLEFYRRAVAAYEDAKIQENGDVYTGGGSDGPGGDGTARMV